MKRLSNKHLLGTSFIEILVSLFLSTFLITALIEHYLITKKQYLQVQNTLENELEIQLVQNLFRDSIRLAGFTPCLSIDRLVTINHQTNNRLHSIQIDSLPAKSLRLFRMKEYFNSVFNFPASNQLLINKHHYYKKDQWVLIADCYHAEVQQIASIQAIGTKNLIYLKQPLYFKYEMPAYIGEWIEETFYIKKNQLGLTFLYYKKDQAEQLAPGILDLSAKLIKRQGKKLVLVTLKNQEGQPIELKTTIRAN